MNWGVRSVTVRFGKRIALSDVTFQALAGQVSGIVGGDGAGKSTLLRALVGAIRPDEGEVLRPGARQIGYMPSTSGVYPDLSVDENIAFAAAAYNVSRMDLQERAHALLSRTGLADVHDRLGGQLSGGMRQKLGVLLAMIHRPSLLVLDEPTTGVDPVSRAGLWWLIARAAAEGAAVVLSTSYVDEAERAAHLLVLDAGHHLASGTPDDIIAAMPGTISRAATRPQGDMAPLSWRRGAYWRVWSPPGVASADRAQVIRPDLQDAVMVASLALERKEATQGGAVR
ncbi:MAG: ABC transporter ATP-binding protein [Thermaerobacter sp.]|nr:ABC transporter ATP-binding protein [Thermaerobacter sp.]